MVETIRRKKTGKIYKAKSSYSHLLTNENKFRAYVGEVQPTMRRLKKAALEASDNGRCWWVYQFIIGGI